VDDNRFHISYFPTLSRNASNRKCYRKPEPPYVITNGTFDTATYFFTMHTMAHEKQKVGLASAMAVVLMLIIIFVTLLQRYISNTFFEEDKHGYVFSERRAMRKRAMMQTEWGNKNMNENIKKIWITFIYRTKISWGWCQLRYINLQTLWEINITTSAPAWLLQ